MKANGEDRLASAAPEDRLERDAPVERQGFLPIETNGDGAVNVYSRVQMQLFKAKQLAKNEVDRALEETGQTLDGVREYVQRHPRLRSAFHKSPHRVGCTAADLVYEVAEHKKRFTRVVDRVTGLWRRRRERAAEGHRVVEIAKIAAARARASASVKQVVKTAGEDPIELDSNKPPIPSGRKTLNVIN